MENVVAIIKGEIGWFLLCFKKGIHNVARGAKKIPQGG